MEQANTMAPEKRPTLLTVLIILTWIGSGLGALAYLLLTIAAGAMGSMLSKIPGVGAMLGAGTVIFLVLFLASVGKIFGAIQMWKMKKMGFFIYVASEVISFGLGAYFAMSAGSAASEAAADMASKMPEGMEMHVNEMPASGGFPVMGLIFTLLFIVLYGLNLKKLK